MKHLEKEKLAATDRPRVAGRHCAERAFLEFHHLVPYAAGGKATVDNVELRCRAHNGYEAEQFFGSA